MNIQDIADFIDLVKNPAKYETVLQNIKDEQARLTAVIETVGKVSEIEQIKKKLEAKYEQLTADFTQATKERDAAVEREVSILAQKKADYESKIKEALLLTETAQAKSLEAKNLLENHLQREKALKQNEDGIRVRQAQLDASITEYNEKLAKLRSVMS